MHHGPAKAAFGQVLCVPIKGWKIFARQFALGQAASAVAHAEMPAVDMLFAANLTLFLNNGGSLWLIGAGIFEDGDVDASFLNNYLYVAKDSGMLGLTSNPMEGVAGHPVTDYFSQKNMTMVERVPGYTEGYDINPLG